MISSGSKQQECFDTLQCGWKFMLSSILRHLAIICIHLSLDWMLLRLLSCCVSIDNFLFCKSHNKKKMCSTTNSPSALNSSIHHYIQIVIEVDRFRWHHSRSDLSALLPGFDAQITINESNFHFHLRIRFICPRCCYEQVLFQHLLSSRCIITTDPSIKSWSSFYLRCSTKLRSHCNH